MRFWWILQFCIFFKHLNNLEKPILLSLTFLVPEKSLYLVTKLALLSILLASWSSFFCIGLWNSFNYHARLFTYCAFLFSGFLYFLHFFVFAFFVLAFPFSHYQLLILVKLWLSQDGISSYVLVSGWIGPLSLVENFSGFSFNFFCPSQPEMTLLNLSIVLHLLFFFSGFLLNVNSFLILMFSHFFCVYYPV